MLYYSTAGSVETDSSDCWPSGVATFSESGLVATVSDSGLVGAVTSSAGVATFTITNTAVVLSLNGTILLGYQIL